MLGSIKQLLWSTFTVAAGIMAQAQQSLLLTYVLQMCRALHFWLHIATLLQSGCIHYSQYNSALCRISFPNARSANYAIERDRELGKTNGRERTCAKWEGKRESLVRKWFVEQWSRSLNCTSNLREKWNDFDYKITCIMYFKGLNCAEMIPFHRKEMISDFCLFP